VGLFLDTNEFDLIDDTNMIHLRKTASQSYGTCSAGLFLAILCRSIHFYRTWTVARPSVVCLSVVCL